MPEQVQCPSCNTALRVPDTLLGKNVKCPKCQTTFLAELEELDKPEGIVREREQSAARRRRPSPPQEEELEEVPEEEDEDYPRRRRRGGRRRAEAMARVSGPATALLVVGIIDIVLALLNIILPLVGFSLLSAIGGGRGARAGVNSDDLMINIVSGVISGIIGLVMGPLITVGAVKMKNLRSYGMAMTACILAMIPCGNCCLLGLPFGIWALVVLNKPEVKDAFRNSR